MYLKLRHGLFRHTTAGEAFAALGSHFKSWSGRYADFLRDAFTIMDDRFGYTAKAVSSGLFTCVSPRQDKLMEYSRCSRRKSVRIVSTFGNPTTAWGCWDIYYWHSAGVCAVVAESLPQRGCLCSMAIPRAVSLLGDCLEFKKGDVLVWNQSRGLYLRAGEFDAVDSLSATEDMIDLMPAGVITSTPE